MPTKVWADAPGETAFAAVFKLLLAWSQATPTQMKSLVEGDCSFLVKRFWSALHPVRFGTPSSSLRATIETRTRNKNTQVLVA